MPTNLLVKYNSLLDLLGQSENVRNRSLRGVFDRDFVIGTPLVFNNKPIYPTSVNGSLPMDTLFRHLTTVIVDQATRKREYERTRSVRLHWVKHQINELCKIPDSNILRFSLKEPDGFRTYIYNVSERYVIVLEPLRDRTAYYLLSAYHVTGNEKLRDKFLKKHKRRLPELL
ncbi:hypothetical protein [Chryseobacterium sp. SIMBA_038]|uniref:hypothetical protein n=1 Tax=Chryseobacterium sp. SIMBA_038 TaxID=3085780 RepID=UPI0039780E8F